MSEDVIGRELIALINDQRALLRDDVHFALPDHDEVGPLLHVYHPPMGLKYGEQCTIDKRVRRTLSWYFRTRQ